MPQEMMQCIDTCRECADLCQTTLFNHCLREGGKHVEQDHVSLMQDCIDICRTSAHFMLRHSAYHEYVCAVCSDICDACATSCEEIGGPEMEACAKICRDCSKQCRKMARRSTPALRRVL